MSDMPKECSCTKCQPVETHGERNRYWGPCLNTRKDPDTITIPREVVESWMEDESVTSTPSGNVRDSQSVEAGIVNETLNKVLNYGGNDE